MAGAPRQQQQQQHRVHALSVLHFDDLYSFQLVASDVWVPIPLFVASIFNSPFLIVLVV
jgi:hypothetical protein